MTLQYPSTWIRLSKLNNITEQLKNFRIVPVIVIHKAEDATLLADTLLKGGLPCAEITFRTAAALGAIRIMTQRKDLLVGAGTVLKIDQAKAAIDAGARFIVSPGFNPKLVTYCVKNNISVIPGICTPSEIEAAMDFGLDVLKFFPAEAFGGLKTLKAMSEPYADVKFIPTGGITLKNLIEYLNFYKVLACGGTWIAPPDLISTGRFDNILHNLKAAISLLKEAKLPVR